jgi:hypothetical protein
VPQIIVTTDPTSDANVAVTLHETVATRNLESDHYAAQLIERIGWALEDADIAQQRASGDESGVVR